MQCYKGKRNKSVEYTLSLFKEFENISESGPVYDFFKCGTYENDGTHNPGADLGSSET